MDDNNYGCGLIKQVDSEEDITGDTDGKIFMINDTKEIKADFGDGLNNFGVVLTKVPDYTKIQKNLTIKEPENFTTAGGSTDGLINRAKIIEFTTSVDGIYVIDMWLWATDVFSYGVYAIINDNTKYIDILRGYRDINSSNNPMKTGYYFFNLLKDTKIEVYLYNVWNTNKITANVGLIINKLCEFKDIISGISKETFFNDVSNKELINRPDKWVAGTEYDFGDGLYGQRFTGSYNITTAGVAYQETIINNARLIDWNGWTGISHGSFSNLNANRVAGLIGGTTYISLYVGHSEIGTRSYDFWIKYVKV
jgi:hypothetical protein